MHRRPEGLLRLSRLTSAVLLALVLGAIAPTSADAQSDEEQIEQVLVALEGRP